MIGLVRTVAVLAALWILAEFQARATQDHCGCCGSRTSSIGGRFGFQPGPSARRRSPMVARRSLSTPHGDRSSLLVTIGTSRWRRSRYRIRAPQWMLAA